jgi:hypothetical protein
VILVTIKINECVENTSEEFRWKSWRTNGNYELHETSVKANGYAISQDNCLGDVKKGVQRGNKY